MFNALAILRRLALALGVCLLQIGCIFSGLATMCTVAAEGPIFPGKHWNQSAPSELHLNGPLLERFASNVGGDGCIVYRGVMVQSWGKVQRHKDWASAAKPVLSTLLLLAVQEHRIPSVDARLSELGWELSDKDQTMTFRHLANMLSGYALAEEPGSSWGYNDYAIKLYALSLQKIYGDSLDAVIRQRLKALQFEDGEIFASRDGAGVTASCRDMARLGWLWLHRGHWNGEPLLDRELFDACIRVQVPAETPRVAEGTHDYLKIGTFGGGTNQTASGPGAYGFNFWFNATLESGNRVWPALPADAFQANGMWNRDTITVIPSWHMVITLRRSSRPVRTRFGEWPVQSEPAAHQASG